MKRLRIASRSGVAIVALAGLLAVTGPVPAEAAHGGGGGGFHGGGGGFHGGGFHAGGFGGGFHGHFGAGHFDRGRFGFRPGWGWGAAGVAAIPFFYDWDNAGYGGSQPEASSQYWYYCQDPAGYYPQVTQCSTAWQPVPAN
jgi:hypothetical protein